ncbi:hypothetical protein NM688_g1798 [Phlebia brevispora]|uniref:Uncharacterized protein n=1 Tax=Phlebia brevispora TaxID=194682 RepID=A0ACC1TA29_9APHY|nr:hypothetical protein NM688_g1798 [Phlebia brevispora]
MMDDACLWIDYTGLLTLAGTDKYKTRSDPVKSVSVHSRLPSVTARAMLVSIDNVADQWFDYVIVGGGTAGLTLAARLTEDAERSVLVIEAGAANIDDPALLRTASYGSHFGNEAYSWNHQTIYQAAVNRRALWPRGKGLGGSSAINFLTWSKPPRQDIDDIERLGNPGWNWDNYHKPRWTAKVDLSCDDRRGRNEVSSGVPVLLRIWKQQMTSLQTVLNAGIQPAPLPYDGETEGFQFSLNTIDPTTHTRVYAANAFYVPNKDRPNFSVLISAYARRVLTAETGSGALSAVGVEFEYEGQVHCVNAREEVILCAGALKTPQLLELSGIGRRDVLGKINVPVKVELPGVGENVQEHMFLGTAYELKEDVEWTTLDLLRDPELLAKQNEQLASNTGVFTTGIVSLVFLPLDKVTSPERAAEIYAMGQDTLKRMVANGAPPANIEQTQILLERLKPGGSKRSPGCEIINFPGFVPGGIPNAPEKGKRYLSPSMALNHNFSRGTIHSVSDDPAKDPAYDPRYMEEAIDLEIALEIIKYVRKLANTAPLKDMLEKELNPGPECQTDDQIREWIKAGFSTTFHTAGSCSMLPRSKGGVVSPELKVYGTNNLRVVDLSIIPLHFAAHAQATVHAIAEQAADIIKGKFKS